MNSNGTFTVYDKTTYTKYQEILRKRGTTQSHEIWKMITQVVENAKNDITDSTQPQIDAFVAPYVMPPRIIEDFDHIIRPFLQRANPDQLKQLKTTGHCVATYARFCLTIPHEKRLSIKRDISYEEALEHVGGIVN